MARPIWTNQGLERVILSKDLRLSDQNDVSAHWRGQIDKKWKFGLINI